MAQLTSGSHGEPDAFVLAATGAENRDHLRGYAGTDGRAALVYYLSPFDALIQAAGNEQRMQPGQQLTALRVADVKLDGLVASDN